MLGRGRNDNGIRHFCLSWSLLCQLEVDEIIEAEMRNVMEAEMRNVMEAEVRKVVEAEMRGIMEAERSATLDSLSPMHAETEGKEPSPSVQLCKVQSR